MSKNQWAGPERSLPSGRGTTFRLQLAEHRCGIVRELLRRTNGTRNEIASAIRATPVQFGLRAIAAESALEAANHRVGGTRRQVFIAAFTIGPKFEHDSTILPRGLIVVVS